jgi:hypothetical protein
LIGDQDNNTGNNKNALSKVLFDRKALEVEVFRSMVDEKFLAT